MPNQSTEITIDFLQAFADAWNRHDVDDLMTFMTNDCVFESSAGDESCGTRYVGREAVRMGYAKAWKDFPDARWSDARHFLSGNRGVSEWVFSGTQADGKRVELVGCDLFSFREWIMSINNSFRKNRPPK